MWWPWKKRTRAGTGDVIELPSLPPSDAAFAPARWAAPSQEDIDKRNFVNQSMAFLERAMAERAAANRSGKPVQSATDDTGKANSGTIIVSRKSVDQSELPNTFQVMLVDDCELPGFGARSGNEYDALILNLVTFVGAAATDKKITITKGNPALRLLADNDPMFQMLQASYRLGGEEAVKRVFSSFNAMAETVVSVLRGEPSSQTEMIVRAQGVSAFQFGEAEAKGSGGNQAVRALFQHVLLLARTHFGYQGNGENLAQMWDGIGSWRY
jgi:hypothetical protein